MENHFLNLAIALVRGHVRDARELVRFSPALFGGQASNAITALQGAVEDCQEQAINRALHRILAESLSLNVDDTPALTEAYFDGVRAVEDLIEKRITDAERGQALPGSVGLMEYA
jgi:hypothetical protein